MRRDAEGGIEGDSPLDAGASSQDPIHLIAQATAGDIGMEFLSSLVRSMRAAMDVSVAFITRGIGEPPVRARAAYSWKRTGVSFPTSTISKAHPAGWSTTASRC
jgi:hypothetical protein